MKLAIIDLNLGQIPKTMKEALSLCPYSKKEIEKYLLYNGILIVNNKAFKFGITILM